MIIVIITIVTMLVVIILKANIVSDMLSSIFYHQSKTFCRYCKKKLNENFPWNVRTCINVRNDNGVLLLGNEMQAIFCDSLKKITVIIPQIFYTRHFLYV